MDKALAIYPERFIQEIKNHSFININICLVGSIKSKDSDGILANGVTVLNWGYECIAVDITGKDIANTLIHEMSHVIDEKLERCGVLNDLDDKWMACNPKDFEYYNSYVGYEKNYKNTSYDNDYWLNDDPETVYFFDDYSKTYVKEDRARLLEHFNDFKVIDDCYKSSHIRAKLEAYFECLKNTFSSFKDFDSTYWGKLSSSNI